MTSFKKWHPPKDRKQCRFSWLIKLNLVPITKNVSWDPIKKFYSWKSITFSDFEDEIRQNKMWNVNYTLCIVSRQILITKNTSDKALFSFKGNTYLISECNSNKETEPNKRSRRIRVTLRTFSFFRISM